MFRACVDLLGRTPAQGALKGMTRQELWQLLQHHARRPAELSDRAIWHFLTNGKE